METMYRSLIGIATTYAIILPTLALIITPQTYVLASNSPSGTPFCDEVANDDDFEGSCYDRNDNPQEYCTKYAQSDEDFCKIIEGPAACGNDGYKDGKDNPFDHDRNRECDLSDDNPYYEGFIRGCLTVEGNTRDICEGATDS